LTPKIKMAQHPFKLGTFTTSLVPMEDEFNPIIEPRDLGHPGPQRPPILLGPDGSGDGGGGDWLDHEYGTSAGNLDDNPGISPQHLHQLIQFIASLDNMGNNSRVDLGSPYLRAIYRQDTPLLVVIVLLYVVLVAVGLVSNLFILAVIIRRRLYTDPVQACVLNINIASVLQLLVVLPLTLFVLLVHNWLLGKFFCYTLPLLQDLPSYVIMLSLMVLTFDRQQKISSNKKTTWFPARVVVPATWILSLLLVIPYIKFITFVPLDRIGPEFRGGQICVVNLENNVAPYMRGLFVTLFLVPVLISVGLMWTVSRKLAAMQTNLMGISMEESENVFATSLEIEAEGDDQSLPANKQKSQNRSNNKRESTSGSNGDPNQELIQSFDIHAEQRAQKFLFLIVLSHFTCVLPINVLKMVRHSVIESDENDAALDLAYVVLVFITFLPTLILPAFYVRWILIGSLCKELFRLTSVRERGSRRKNTAAENIFASPSPQSVRNEEVENFREEVERQVRERQASIPKNGNQDNAAVMETVLMRRASIMSTVNDTLLLQPVNTRNANYKRRQSAAEPTHFKRKNSIGPGKRPRRYSVAHP